MFSQICLHQNRKKLKVFQISPRIPTDTLLHINPLLKVQDSEGNEGLGDFVVVLWCFLGDFMMILH